MNTTDKNQKREPASLGEIVNDFMNTRILPKRGKYDSLLQQWNQILPAELSKHCKIVDILNGQLTVEAESSSYVYELKLCTTELLKKLQQECPRLRLKKLKVVVR